MKTDEGDSVLIWFGCHCPMEIPNVLLVVCAHVISNRKKNTTKMKIFFIKKNQPYDDISLLLLLFESD